MEKQKKKSSDNNALPYISVAHFIYLLTYVYTVFIYTV